MPRILVIRPGALGDTILALPLAQSIRQACPDAELTFLGTRSYSELMIPDVTFQAVDRQQWLWLFSEERSQVPNGVPSFHMAYVILAQPETVMRNLSRAGTERLLHVSSRPLPGIHMVEHLHQGLGIPVPPRRPVLSHLAPTERTDIIWMHPGSGGPGKCMPLQSMRLLARRLRNRFGWDIAVTAGEEDAFLKEQPEWDKLIHGANIHLFENRPLAELCAELGGARLFVGNDSGISHLAAGLGIRSVVIFVSSDPVQWAPWAPVAQVSIVDWRDRPHTTASLETEVLGLVCL